MFVIIKHEKPTSENYGMLNSLLIKMNKNIWIGQITSSVLSKVIEKFKPSSAITSLVIVNKNTVNCKFYKIGNGII